MSPLTYHTASGTANRYVFYSFNFQQPDALLLAGEEETPWEQHCADHL